MSVTDPWTKRQKPPKPTIRVQAFYDDEDARFATVDGTVYPVLLTAFLTGSSYAEEVTNEKEYPPAWCHKFHAELMRAQAAVLSRVASNDSWPFIALHRIENPQLSNFITCTLGAKLVKLKSE